MPNRKFLSGVAVLFIILSFGGIIVAQRPNGFSLGMFMAAMLTLLCIARMNCARDYVERRKVPRN